MPVSPLPMSSPPLLLALTLGALLAPAPALAQRSCGSTPTTSCPEGHSYDSEAQICLPLSS